MMSLTILCWYLTTNRSNADLSPCCTRRIRARSAAPLPGGCLSACSVKRCSVDPMLHQKFARHRDGFPLREAAHERGMILAQFDPARPQLSRDMRRSFATPPIEKRSQLPPLFGPDLIGDEQYVAFPWTCSKVEPDPQRAEQRPRS